MEKNMKKYIYVKLNHFAVQQKLTQQCTSTILQLKKKDCALIMDYFLLSKRLMQDKF